MRPRRSLLFAPANRTEVHAKALASGADCVCLDLEDALAPDFKDQGRTLALPFLQDAPGPERVVRINSLRSALGLRDMLAVLAAAPPEGVILLPKVAEAGEVRLAADLLTEAGSPLGLAVLIESVAGVLAVEAILAASPRIRFAMFGGIDLAAEMGIAPEAAAMSYARQRMVLAARAAGIDAMDVPCMAFRDVTQVGAEAAAARAIGFTGKAALHPASVAPINAAFAPDPAELAHAEAVIAAYRASPNGLAVLNGKLVEKPVVAAATRLLALRDRIGSLR
jgi:citrate lyase beta subunit